MIVHNCLSCHEPAEENSRHHPRCIRAIFARTHAPTIPFGIADMPSQVVNSGARMSLSGVQMKLSVRIHPETGVIETVSEGGTHILKPEPNEYPELPAIENVCMNIATMMKLKTPPHGLFQMADGRLCYIVRRFDRLQDGTKLQKETMYQILESADKYRGSLEQVGKVIRAHATHIGLDLLDFFERALLCFLIGNGDMHLKNWALLTTREGSVGMAPCYDLVSSKVYLPDEHDFALTINSKQNKLLRKDFDALASALPIDAKAAAHVFRKLFDAQEKILDLCRSSALSEPMREKLMKVIDSRYTRMYS